MSLAEALSKARQTDVFPDLIHLINRRLESTVEIPIPTADQPYRVSRLVKMCPREEVLRAQYQVKKTERIDARLQRIFDIGTAVHEFIQNHWFGAWGYLWGHWHCLGCGKKVEKSFKPERCSCENADRGWRYEELTFIDPEHGVTAHADGVVVIDGRKYILEIKTCNSKQFQLIRDVKKRPLEAHVHQVQLYMWLSGVSRAMIVYIDKDESQLQVFHEEHSKTVVDGFIRRIHAAREGIRTQVVPEREICATAKCARAQACSVRSICFRGS